MACLARQLKQRTRNGKTETRILWGWWSTTGASGLALQHPATCQASSQGDTPAAIALDAAAGAGG